MNFRPKLLLSTAFVLLLLGFAESRGTLFASWRKPVKAKHGMVVSAESLATRAGVEVLKNGGNAIDAAVAVGFTLAVTFPEAGNIGGGGFMLIRLPNGKCTMIDFREKAPGKAARTMYLDSAGNFVSQKSEYGPLAAGVPGSVAGLLYALEKYGTASRAQVLARPIEIAERGLIVSERLAAGFKESLEEFAAYPSTMRAFTKNGVPFHEGELFLQPELAYTLREIREKGRDGFYKGDIAAKIVAEMHRGGGIMTMDDLAAYRAIEREPVRGTYRGYDIVSASPPSAGGVVLLQMLNMLERFDLRSKGHNSSQTIHLFAAAAQRAYADRSEFLGDPDFVKIPVKALIAKKYAAGRSRSIDSMHAVAGSAVRPGASSDVDNHQTTHFCVADRFGNVVSVTTTVNGLYGCKTVVDGAGFFLNNEMDDFAAKPGTPNMFGLIGGDANAIAPHKRMLSSMTPTIVLKNGKPLLTVGARGGSRITTAVATILLNVIDFEMNIQDAVDIPRVHHQWLPDKIFYEANGLPLDVIRNLQHMGYTLEHTHVHNARAEALMIDPVTGEFLGAPDPREEGVAIGF
ncbi:MAG: gamma-glutamyltransferase [Ignavibacteriae bacterium]|nr:gamma-glutamyltransferase [Ignavibacteriota bacterium]